jgi:hypothetical protein
MITSISKKVNRICERSAMIIIIKIKEVIYIYNQTKPFLGCICKEQHTIRNKRNMDLRVIFITRMIPNIANI